MKISSKWVIDLSIRAKTIRAIEENIGNLCDLWLGREFLDMIPKEWCLKEKNYKFDFIKTKLLFFKGHSEELKSSTLGENICETYLIKDWYPDYKKFSKFSLKKETKNNLI